MPFTFPWLFEFGTATEHLQNVIRITHILITKEDYMNEIKTLIGALIDQYKYSQRSRRKTIVENWQGLEFWYDI